MPGQLIDDVVRLWDPLTSPGVGLGGVTQSGFGSAACAEGLPISYYQPSDFKGQALRAYAEMRSAIMTWTANRQLEKKRSNVVQDMDRDILEDNRKYEELIRRT